MDKKQLTEADIISKFILPAVNNAGWDSMTQIRETNQAWKVSIDEVIKRNFNLDIKNPYVEDVISHDPDELLVDYAKQKKEIREIRNQLKKILGDALGNNS